MIRPLSLCQGGTRLAGHTYPNLMQTGGRIKNVIKIQLTNGCRDFLMIFKTPKSKYFLGSEIEISRCLFWYIQIKPTRMLRDQHVSKKPPMFFESVKAQESIGGFYMNGLTNTS